MSIDPQSFRAEGDARLAEELLANQRVQDALKAVELAEEKGQIPQMRRRLMGRAIRLSEVVAPNLNRIVQQCSEILGIDEPVECYVHPSPMFNAGIFRPEGGRLLIMFSSSLIEGFETIELTFVVGHELAHHVYSHHDIPVGVLFDPRFGICGSLALQLSAWQRYAEISCDRAGLVCTGDFAGAARSLFKLASGLEQAPNDEQVMSFLEQAQQFSATSAETHSAGGHEEEWFASHPFSPLRVQAAHLFTQSSHFPGGERPAEWLEVRVAELMSIMEPGYLKEDSETAEAMRRLLFAGAIVLAAKHGGITPEEVAALDDLLGPGSTPRDPDVDTLAAVLDERIANVVRLARLGQRAQVLRDLATIAQSDGHTHADERRFLCQIADKLEVDKAVVDTALCAAHELD